MLPLDKPIILAPMAGGPSTPELCAAVSEAGGFGFLATGYLTPELLSKSIATVTSLTKKPFGVNIFVPENPRDTDQELWNEYRSRISHYQRIHCGKSTLSSKDLLPSQPQWNDDFYREKIDIALNSDAEVLSFTFGYPTEDILSSVHEAGKKAVVNATTPREIDYVLEMDVDAIVLQGKDAGGHRASVLDLGEEGFSYSTLELLAYARPRTEKTLYAAGGIGTSVDCRIFLSAGAEAVQVGTRFLLAHESGTKSTHKRALLELKDRNTRLTQAFSGRWARTIDNDFSRELSDSAPSLYPEIHYLTATLRKEADREGDMENLNLWAGTQFSYARPASAVEIIEELFP